MRRARSSSRKSSWIHQASSRARGMRSVQHLGLKWKSSQRFDDDTLLTATFKIIYLVHLDQTPGFPFCTALITRFGTAAYVSFPNQGRLRQGIQADSVYSCYWRAHLPQTWAR